MPPPKTKQPPTALETGLEKVQKMIDWGRLRFPLASANLKHWRDGHGRERTLTARDFSGEPFLLQHLRGAHRSKFIDGAKRRLGTGELGPGKSASMEWTDSVNAPYFTDLYFALGGFTLHSVVRVSVEEKQGKLMLRFDEWKTEIADDYNWDPGKATLIPGIGRIEDAEMLALERAGHGRAYKIRSEWAYIKDPETTADFVLADLAPPSSSTTPSRR